MDQSDLRAALTPLIESSSVEVTHVAEGVRTLKKSRGRPKKDGERYPGGKLKSERKSGGIEPIAPALWERLKTEAARVLNDSRFGSELGRLSMHGELSSTQTAAGFRIAQIYGRFERFKGLRRSAGSASYMVASSSFDGDAAEAITPQMLARSMAEELMDATALQELEADIHAAEEMFGKLQKRMRVIPSNVRAAIELLCVDDAMTNPTMLDNLRLALDELALFFRIKAAPKEKKKVREVAVTPDRREVAVADPDKTAWLISLGKLRPDLSAPDLIRVYAMTAALKVREAMRRGKGQRPQFPECAISEVERVRRKVVRERNARLGKIRAEIRA